MSKSPKWIPKSQLHLHPKSQLHLHLKSQLHLHLNLDHRHNLNLDLLRLNHKDPQAHLNKHLDLLHLNKRLDLHSLHNLDRLPLNLDLPNLRHKSLLHLKNLQHPLWWAMVATMVEVVESLVRLLLLAKSKNCAI